MKKVVFIVTQSEFGGAQRYVFEVASGLDKNKYDVVVVAGQGDKELFAKLKHSVNTKQLTWLKRTPWPWQVFLSIFEILNLLKTERPDILFLCSTTAGFLGSIAAYLYRFRVSGSRFQVIYRIGGWAFRDPRPVWINKIILLAEKLTATLKDKIVVNSELDKNLALEYKICQPGRLIKIYNGIDPDKLKFLVKEDARHTLSKLLPRGGNLTPKAFLVGTVANLYKTKGLEYLVESAHILNTKYKIQNTKYIIIGEGKERGNLENLIKKYNLEDRIYLVGRVANAYHYLKAFDVFVLPSVKEGFPWIILETMAAQVPIIATKVGALPEIITSNDQGFLIKPKDSQPIEDKINWVSKNQSQASDIVFEAQQKLYQFNLSKMIEETERLLI
jgi:glycosyltransferase involved in cell wall biosynthesis